VRQVLLYLDHPVPPMSTAVAATPGLGVIATESAYMQLGRAAPLSAPLLVAEGRIGNLGRGRVMMGLIAPEAPAR
jgi:hypothetical protein